MRGMPWRAGGAGDWGDDVGGHAEGAGAAAVGGGGDGAAAAGAGPCTTRQPPPFKASRIPPTIMQTAGVADRAPLGPCCAPCRSGGTKTGDGTSEKSSGSSRREPMCFLRFTFYEMPWHFLCGGASAAASLSFHVQAETRAGRDKAALVKAKRANAVEQQREKQKQAFIKQQARSQSKQHLTGSMQIFADTPSECVAEALSGVPDRRAAAEEVATAPTGYSGSRGRGGGRIATERTRSARRQQRGVSAGGAARRRRRRFLWSRICNGGQQKSGAACLTSSGGAGEEERNFLEEEAAGRRRRGSSSRRDGQINDDDAAADRLEDGLGCASSSTTPPPQEAHDGSSLHALRYILPPGDEASRRRAVAGAGRHEAQQRQQAEQHTMQGRRIRRVVATLTTYSSPLLLLRTVG